MRNLNEANVTDAALGKLENCVDQRLKDVMASLVRHLHGFIQEVEPTEGEWLAGVRFLTEVGQKCDETRQEYILLSDILGASILMDAINHRTPEGATESSVLGPFYREGAPTMERGANIAGDTEGEAVTFRGRVHAPDGRPVEGAVLDVWQTAPNGLYEVQDPNQPDFNLRGKFATDADGAYEFRTVKPVSYSIPDDGPVGNLLKAVGRHTFRPAHVHFIVSADGYEPVVTQLFTEGDEYLESDAVFGVKNSLVVPYRSRNGGHLVEYDFGLQPIA